jgi:REP element-mobilizing transposase RayT
MTQPKKPGPVNPDRIVDPRSLPKVEALWRGDLPHIYKEGCTYFVTFCLVDAVPDRLKRRRKIEEDENPLKVAERYDLDPSVGSRILERSDAASIVERALLHFQGERYALSAWCVMPNHVHAVVTPFSGHTFSKVLHSWKSYSAHKINKCLERRGHVWQQESFDHLVRHESAFEQFVAYIENNPVVAGLCDVPEFWPFSSARFRK